MKRKSTLRKLPPKTREIARLLNELESVSNRLSSRLGEFAKLEKNAAAFEVMNRISPGDKNKLIMELAKSAGMTYDDLEKLINAGDGEDTRVGHDDLHGSGPVQEAIDFIERREG